MSNFNQKFVTSYPTKHLVITPDDGVRYDEAINVLSVSGGDVAVADEAGTVVVYVGTPAYFVIPVTASKIMATGTTATSLIGIYGQQ